MDIPNLKKSPRQLDVPSSIRPTTNVYSNNNELKGLRDFYYFIEMINFITKL